MPDNMFLPPSKLQPLITKRESLLKANGEILAVSVETRKSALVHQATEIIWASCDSISVLPYDSKRETVLLVRQARAAPLLADNAVILEACAGGIEDSDDDIEAAVHREAMEEMGCKLNSLVKIATVYINPARMKERAHLFLAGYTQGSARAEIRQQDEDENIEIIELPLKQLQQIYKNGEIQCPRLMMLYQALQLRLSS